jgi:selenocysteine-specific elongation factor
MEHIIIGTAGHIDHGKTTLIKALTGRDTDTHKEEKKRGISIDLGFTYFDLPHIEKRAGIIDVPGHEKFLPNMLAGVIGMDLVLLVIAIDDGIMPQTLEHMEILRQLDIQDTIIVLTKRDKVEIEWAELMKEEIREELKGTIYEKAPMVEVSSLSGEGIEQLIQVMEERVGSLKERHKESGPVRMYVDRVFSLIGIGTVVTGTIIEGSIQKDQQVSIYPKEIEVKVRTIQVHGLEVDKAYCGQRVAINIAGLKTSEIERGDVITREGRLQNTGILDVKLVMGDTEREVINRMRVHLHVGTRELLCRIVLLDRDTLTAGESAYAQLLLEEKIAVRRNDRFVIRFYSPLETIGGGIILDEFPNKRKRYQNQDIEYHQQKENNQDENIIQNFLEKNLDTPLSMQEISDMTRISIDSIWEYGQTFIENGEFICFHGGKKKFFWLMEAYEIGKNKLKESLVLFHKKYPYRLGMTNSNVRTIVFGTMELSRYDLMIHQMEDESVIQKSGDFISLQSFNVEEDGEFRRIKKILEDAFRKAGYDFIQLTDINFGQIKGTNVEDVKNRLVEAGEIVKVSDEFYTSTHLIDEAEVKIKDYFTREEILSIGRLRDLLGTSRRSAKPLLALMDKRKVTAWSGKETERRKWK